VRCKGSRWMQDRDKEKEVEKKKEAKALRWSGSMVA
jgi:hypothetical protein